MANRLKDIFSNEPPGYGTTVKFRDNDSYRNFQSALDAVANDGCVVPVDGVESISMYMQDHGMQFPIEQHTEITYFVVGPSIEIVPYSVSWEGCEKNYNFRRYRINEGVVLETDKKAVIYLKLVFSEQMQKAKFTCRIQYQYAKAIDDISFELRACVSFISKFYAPTAENGTNEDVARIDEMLRYFRYLEGFIARLRAVEQVIGVTFSPELIPSMSRDDQQDVEELYLLLCRKVPLRLNAKINDSDANYFKGTEFLSEPIVGNGISIVFVREVVYDLLGQKFSIYTTNAVINAIIKDIQKDGEKTTVFYGDTDSHPMYISYSAYLKEVQAQEEAKRNIGSEKQYIEAITGIQYVKEYFGEINNNVQ